MHVYPVPVWWGEEKGPAPSLSQDLAFIFPITHSGSTYCVHSVVLHIISTGHQRRKEVRDYPQKFLFLKTLFFRLLRRISSKTSF